MRTPFKALCHLEQRILFVVLLWLAALNFASAQIACPTYSNVILTATKMTACEGDPVSFLFNGYNVSNPSHVNAPFVVRYFINDTIVADTSKAGFITRTLKSSDVVYLTMTYNFNGCFSVGVSNKISGFNIIPRVKAVISISSSQTGPVCLNTPITYTATAINGGNAPDYEWQVNGTDVPGNGATFTSSNLKRGDQVTCILNVTDNSCVVSNGVVSNSLTPQFLPSPSPAPGVFVDAPVSKIYPGTLVTFTATTANTGASVDYQWQVNGVNVGTDSKTYSSSTLNNND